MTRMLKQRSRWRGFTLVELMSVVAIISVLAVIAGVAYRRLFDYVRRFEAVAMFAEIRAKEEAYRTEYSTYISSTPGATESDLWPALLGGGAGEPKPKNFYPTPAGSSWATLGITPGKSMLYCGYVVIAGPLGAQPTGTQGQAAFPAAPTTQWWYAVAQCDFDGKGPPNATYVATSDRDTIFEENVGR